MADCGTKHFSEEWGYTQDTIRKWCKNGLIPGVSQDGKGSTWHIPKDAQCPKPIKSRKKGGNKK